MRKKRDEKQKTDLQVCQINSAILRGKWYPGWTILISAEASRSGLRLSEPIDHRRNVHRKFVAELFLWPTCSSL